MVHSRATAQWYNYNDASIIHCVLNDGGSVWAGSDGGGLIKYDKATGAKTYYNRATSGLRSPHITAMIKDGNNMIWIGTDGGGLMKFDGNATWTSFKTNNSALPSNTINALAAGTGGHVWVATPNGVSDFDGTVGWSGWTNYTTDNSGLIDNRVTAVSAGTDGSVWIGTISKGLMKYAGGTWTSYRKGNSGLSSDSVTTINANVFGNLWIGTANGRAAQFDKATNWTNIDLTLPDPNGFPLTYRPIYEIREGGDNTILFSTYTDLAIWDGSTATRYPKGAMSSAANAVYSAFADADKKIWCATQAGVAHDTTGTYTFKRYNLSATGMIGNNIDGIMVDKDLTIWMGSLGALMKFDRTNWQVWGPNVFRYRAIRMAAHDSSGNYWVTTGDGVDKYDGSQFRTQTITDAGRKFDPVITDKNGNVWMGGDAGLAMSGSTGITVFNNANTQGFPPGGVTALALGKDGTTIWVGMDFGGLVKYDGSTWKAYTADEHPEMGSSLIRALAVDRATGDVWFGTADAGFTKFDGTTFTNYATFNSPKLPSDNITGIAVDQYGAVWAATGSQGLAKLKGSKWNVYSSENSGISDDHLTSVAVSPDQNIWIGTTSGGLVMYDEAAVLGVDAEHAASSARMLVASTPNPFAGSTNITVNIATRGHARLAVCDARGTEVALLHDGMLDAGSHQVAFDAAGLPAGAYFARITANGVTETLPMVLAR